MNETRRLFIASPLGEPARQALLDFETQKDTIAKQIPGRPRWVPSENWHLTWLFLGNVEAAAIPDMQERLASTVARCQPVSAELQDITLWPNARRATTLVCQVLKSNALSHLAEAIHASLPQFPADKAFNPHITLARLKAERHAASSDPAFQSIRLSASWPLETVSLYESVLTPNGAIYRAIQTFPMAL